MNKSFLNPGRRLVGKPFVTEGSNIFCGEQVRLLCKTSITYIAHSAPLAKGVLVNISAVARSIPMYVLCIVHVT